LVAVNVQHAAVAHTLLPPCTWRVGLASRGDEAWFSVLHRHAVKMTAVFRPQRANKARLPDRPEAGLLIDRSEAGKQRVDEYRAAGRQHADIVREHIPGIPGDLRYIDGIVALELLPERHD